MRFGVLIGPFLVFYVVVGTYATMNVGALVAVYLAIATLAEWGIVGSAIGLVYKPTAPASTVRRRAGV